MSGERFEFPVWIPKRVEGTRPWMPDYEKDARHKNAYDCTHVKTLNSDATQTDDAPTHGIKQYTGNSGKDINLRCLEIVHLPKRMACKIPNSGQDIHTSVAETLYVS